MNLSARSERLDFRDIKLAHTHLFDLCLVCPVFPYSHLFWPDTHLRLLRQSTHEHIGKILEPYVRVCSLLDKEGFHCDMGSGLCHLCKPDDHLHHKPKSTRHSGAPACFLGHFQSVKVLTAAPETLECNTEAECNFSLKQEI